MIFFPLPCIYFQPDIFVFKLFFCHILHHDQWHAYDWVRPGLGTSLKFICHPLICSQSEWKACRQENSGWINQPLYWRKFITHRDHFELWLKPNGKWVHKKALNATALLQPYWIIDFVCHLSLFWECVLSQWSHRRE